MSFHNSIWATSFQGGLGCMQDWWWEHGILENDLNIPHEDQFTALNWFMNNSGIDYDGNNYIPQRYPITPSDNDNSFPLFEAFSLVSEDQNRAVGWVHNRTKHWGNDDNCSWDEYDDEGNFVQTHNVPADNDIFTSPVILPVDHTFNFQIRDLKSKKKYDIEWHDTFFPNVIFDSDQDIETNSQGVLTIYPPITGGRFDAAYTIALDGFVFKTGLNDSLQADAVAIERDTLIADRNPIPNMTIFPNPSSGTFNVEISNLEDECVLSVYNILGDRIWVSEEISGNMLLNLSEQPKGIYVIRLDADHYSIHKKIVVH